MSRNYAVCAHLKRMELDRRLLTRVIQCLEVTHELAEKKDLSQMSEMDMKRLLENTEQALKRLEAAKEIFEKKIAPPEPVPTSTPSCVLTATVKKEPSEIRLDTTGLPQSSGWLNTKRRHQDSAN